MALRNRLAAGFAALFRSRRADEELDDELREYLEAAVEQKRAEGMSRTDALRAARAEMGSAAAVKDWVRDVGWESRVETVGQDVRYAFRLLKRSPGFACAAILTFALGIGANTAIFSIVDAAVLRPLPYDEPDRLVSIHLQNPVTGRTSDGLMPRDFLDWRERQQVFEHFAFEAGGSFTLLGSGEPEQLSAGRVSAGFFETRRVRPLMGRLFTTADEFTGRDHVAILSHGFWQARFGGRADAVGSRLHLNGDAYEIVGVLPEQFQSPVGRVRQTPVFLPFTFTDEHRQYGVVQSMWGNPTGRLAPGVTIAQAEAALTQLQAALDVRHQGFNKGYSRVELRPLLERYIGTARPWMVMLLGAVSCVLLIACANVANLALAHATTRTRELTLRAALGASRSRIASQLLAETLVIAVLGAAAGFAVAWWSLAALKSAIPTSIPRAASIGLDLRVLGFTGVLALATGLLCGLLPALRASRVDLAGGLKDGASQGATAGRGQLRLRHTIALAEVALAVVLLVGSGLFISSFVRLLRVDTGFDATGIVTMGVSLPRVEDAAQRNWRLLPEMLAAARTVPGVEAAVLADGGGPYEGGYSTFPLRIVGRPAAPGEEKRDIRFREVSSGFLEMLRVPLVRGRFLDAGDRRGARPVAIINLAAARQFWGEDDPIGDHIEIVKVQYEIVGIAGDMRYLGPAAPAVPEAFIPYEQAQYGGGTFLVRGAPDAGDVVSAVKAAIWSVDPSRPIQDVRTAEELFHRSTAARRFNMLLMCVFAALALVIAVTGIYGVLAFVVSQRTREIGVRLALGARGTEIIALFLRQGAVVLGAGILTGLLGAWTLARSVQAFLFEIDARDPVVFGAVAILLAWAGLTACWIPARRAARIDPLVALRTE